MPIKEKYTGKPRGGPGLGQGKKPKESKSKSYKLDLETVKILETKPNATKFIESAVKHYDAFLTSRVEEAEILE